MPVCHKRKLAFCHIPRTGGVSITDTLQMEIPDRHFKASWYREKYPDYFLFATHRDYEDRIRSAFGWKLPEIRQKEAGTLDELVQIVKKKGDEVNSVMIKSNEYFLDCEVDCILQFNNLQDDLNSMLSKLGYSSVKLPNLNSFK